MYTSAAILRGAFACFLDGISNRAFHTHGEVVLGR
jgi:hypothetical protein